MSSVSNHSNNSFIKKTPTWKNRYMPETLWTSYTQDNSSNSFIEIRPKKLDDGRLCYQKQNNPRPNYGIMKSSQNNKGIYELLILSLPILF